MQRDKYSTERSFPPSLPSSFLFRRYNISPLRLFSWRFSLFLFFPLFLFQSGFEERRRPLCLASLPVCARDDSGMRKYLHGWRERGRERGRREKRDREEEEEEPESLPLPFSFPRDREISLSFCLCSDLLEEEGNGRGWGRESQGKGEGETARENLIPARAEGRREAKTPPPPTEMRIGDDDASILPFEMQRRSTPPFAIPGGFFPFHCPFSSYSLVFFAGGAKMPRGACCRSCC